MNSIRARRCARRQQRARINAQCARVDLMYPSRLDILDAPPELLNQMILDAVRAFEARDEA